MAPPLAGRPPFATDEPDSFYETPQPQRRIRQPAPPNPNARTSAYDVYDNYLHDPAKRQSGAGALGLGFMNGSMDDEDDEKRGYRQYSSKHEEAQASSKHAMLATATGAGHDEPPPQYIAAPRPGYAAPIAALNLSRPEAAATPAIRQPLENPFEPQNHRGYGPPSPMTPLGVPSSPHPLQPPMSPITPVFARPAKDIQFSADEKPIMRGKTEDTFLPSRGQRGDDFWRRFSMVVHEQENPNKPKKSSWLKKTQNGSSRMSRWVWVIGFLLALTAAGAIGLGWYLSHNDTSHNAPKTLGGSAKETGGASLKVVGTDSAGLKTSLHVSPTNTVARRVFAEAFATPLPRDVSGGQNSRKKHLNRNH